jgi:LytS/YehU family sensor histidine kinase
MFGQKRYLKRRYQRERLLAELKLKSIRNQLDPHFTFNAVNAIASAIFKEDKHSAYNYFSKFSKLVRSTMLYSDRMTRLLDDELDFTLKYLEIEKFRFREKFEFEIKVDDDVNLNMEVPRMIVQAYVESAINNGLMHRTTNGLLLVKVYSSDRHLTIEIDDNGVGIEKSKELNKEKAFKSVKIMEEFIAVFNEFNKAKITCEMNDLFEDGKVLGTRVFIKIPFDIKYAFSGIVNR